MSEMERKKSGIRGSDIFASFVSSNQLRANRTRRYAGETPTGGGGYASGNAGGNAGGDYASAASIVSGPCDCEFYLCLENCNYFSVLYSGSSR